MIPADHHDPVVRLGQPPRDLYEDLIIVTGLFKSKTAVTGYDEQSVRHTILNTQFEHHFLKSPVDVSADDKASRFRIIK
jgi:hypothetical protein